MYGYQAKFTSNSTIPFIPWGSIVVYSQLYILSTNHGVVKQARHQAPKAMFPGHFVSGK